MPITTEKIYRFEEIRARGSRAQKSDMAFLTLPQEAGIDMLSVSGLPKQDLTNYMRAWRIWTTTLMQLYKGEWNGNRAAQFLWEARNVFNYYNHRSVVEAAQQMKTDPENHEYQMRAEMLRDKGQYWLRLAELTGNPELIKRAGGCFMVAIEEAAEGTSIRALVSMEKEIARRKLGIKMSWPDFSSAYQIVSGLSSDAGNWDRLATVSWMYTKEALLAGKKEQFQDGLTSLQLASKNLSVNWIKYPLKEISGVPLDLSRRATYRP